MKKYFIIPGILVAGALAASLSGCGIGGGGGGGGSGVSAGKNTVILKGTFSGKSHARSPGRLDPNQVSKVIVFYLNGGYEVSNVTDGSFSIEVEKGSPVGLVFVGPNNNYLGYLTLKNGIDSLPLNKVREGVTTIDLQTLSSSGVVVEPGHNPLGLELPLAYEEQKSIALMDDSFSCTVKNPDMDGNGTIDLLENKFFRTQILYFIGAGTFEGNNLTPAPNPAATINGYRLMLGARDTDRPNTVFFTGPPGSGLSNSPSEQPNWYEDHTDYFSPYVGYPNGSAQTWLPPGGTYIVSYSTSTLTFNIPDQSEAPYRVVLPVPTVTLNPDGTMHKFNWVYKLPGGNTNLDPKAVIAKIMLQIDGSGPPPETYPQPDRIYNSDWLPGTTTEHVLKYQNLKWSNVTRIYMAYQDVYGNHNVVTWNINK